MIKRTEDPEVSDDYNNKYQSRCLLSSPNEIFPIQADAPVHIPYFEEDTLMLMAVIGICLAGFVILLISARTLVASAVELGHSLYVSPLFIGLTAVAFGTSAPELAASALAASRGVPELAVGNALGSNLANVGVALGLAALIWPMHFRRRMAHVGMPIMLLVTLLAGALLWDGRLTRLEGVALLACLPTAIWWLAGGDTVDEGNDNSLWAPLLIFALSLGFLLLGADLLVRGATGLAEYLDVDPLIAGLVIVALGTSLPEIAVTVMASLRHQPMLALGSIVGSNIFNLLGVMGVAAVISEWHSTSEGFWARDYGATLGLSLLLGLALWWGARSEVPRLGRFAGAALLSGYLLYLYILWRTAL